MPTVRVDLGKRAYPVVIGPGVTGRLKSLLEKQAGGAGRVFVFFDAQVYALHGVDVIRCLGPYARKASVMALPGGERTKTVRMVGRVHDYLLAEQVSRNDFILACGGGVLSDVVGYAASTVLRGVRWGVISTTLLGMVDAAIGGKTGVNHPRGKNLVGAFWQPSFVVCDTFHLHTLPARERVAGMGEIVKYAGLTGGAMLTRLEQREPGEWLKIPRALTGVIEQSVRCKANIVGADETEQGRRMLLNLGHTFAHGIERAAGYGRLLHGEAVLVGLLAACELSVRAGVSSERKLSRYCSILEQYIRHIPYRRLEAEAVWEGMTWDKKRRGGRLRFVLLSEPGRPLIADAVNSAEARRALQAAIRYYDHTGGSHAASTRGERTESQYGRNTRTR